jgi:hypothetical protein
MLERDCSAFIISIKQSKKSGFFGLLDSEDESTVRSGNVQNWSSRDTV